MLLGTLICTVLGEDRPIIVDVGQGKLLNPDGTVIANLSNQIHACLQDLEHEAQLQMVRLNSNLHTDYTQCTCGDFAKDHNKAYVLAFITYYGCSKCGCPYFK